MSDTAHRIARIRRNFNQEDTMSTFAPFCSIHGNQIDPEQGCYYCERERRNAEELAELEALPTCDNCGERFTDAGDGYCDLCPACADEDQYGFGQDHWLPSMQEMIDSGQAWRMEGSIGRQCMDCIESGDCILGETGHRDYWGNYVPSRHEVLPGTLGSEEYARERQENR
jgi:hypothetical protein